VVQPLGRGQYVIQQADHPQIEIQSQVKSQKIVIDSLGDQIKKPDLAAYLDTRGGIVDLPAGQASLAQQNVGIDTVLLRMRVQAMAPTALGAILGRVLLESLTNRQSHCVG
jgi:hypothetical protein